jgi:hypothetical protein
VTALVVTHQIRDAVYIARHRAVRNDETRIVPASAAEAAQARFMVLHDGRMHFEGNVDALLSSPDAYLREYLLDTLPPW